MSDNYNAYYTFRMPRVNRQRKQFSLPNYDEADPNSDSQSEYFADANGTVRQVHHRTSAPPLSSKVSTSAPAPNYSHSGNNSSPPYGASRQPQWTNGDRSYGYDRQIENGYRTLPSRFHDAMRLNKNTNPDPVYNPNRIGAAAGSGRSPTESEYSVVNNFDYYRRQQLKQSALPSLPVNHRYSIAQPSEPVPPQPPADYDDDTPSPPQFSRSKSTRDRDRRGKSSSSLVSSAAPPPPPPPPPLPGQTKSGKRGSGASSSSSRHSHHVQNPPPPPPPPPPPTGSSNGGTVSGRKSHSHESKAAATSTSTIKSKKSLVPPGAVMGGGDDRSEMMKQIQQGVKLKKVSKRSNQRLI